MKKIILFYLILVSLNGCFSRHIAEGNNFDIGNVDKIVKGITTKNEILTMFGEPYEIEPLSPTHERWSYAYIEGEANVQYYYVYTVAETVLKQQKFLYIEFKDDLVSKFDFSEINLPIANHNNSLELNSFSIKPPHSKEWYIHYKGRDVITFRRVGDSEKQIIEASVTAHNIENAITSNKDLENYVRKMLDDIELNSQITYNRVDLTNIVYQGENAITAIIISDNVQVEDDPDTEYEMKASANFIVHPYTRKVLEVRERQILPKGDKYSEIQKETQPFFKSLIFNKTRKVND